jgi:hypothetical protein
MEKKMIRTNDLVGCEMMGLHKRLLRGHKDICSRRRTNIVLYYTAFCAICIMGIPGPGALHLYLHLRLQLQMV